MTEGNLQLIEGGQHVEGVLAHGIVGEIGRRRRPVAFAAAAPVDADDTHAAGKQRGGEFDPVLAGEIAVDEDDGDIALAPLSPAELDLARSHPCHHQAPYLFRPAVGDALGGVGATPTVVSFEVPLTRRSMAIGELTTTLPSSTKSTTSVANCTGLSVWMK